MHDYSSFAWHFFDTSFWTCDTNISCLCRLPLVSFISKFSLIPAISRNLSKFHLKRSETIELILWHDWIFFVPYVDLSLPYTKSLFDKLNKGLSTILRLLSNYGNEPFTLFVYRSSPDKRSAKWKLMNFVWVSCCRGSFIYPKRGHNFIIITWQNQSVNSFKIIVQYKLDTAHSSIKLWVTWNCFES